MGYHRKLSLTGQWQFPSYREWVITENCHWPVNDNFSQFNGLIWSGLMQRIMHSYGHTTYGHMSLTTVNDKNLWTKLKKLSLTLVNDKKIVIDHGQWQKKLSLTESDLYRDIICFLSKVSESWVMSYSKTLKDIICFLMFDKITNATWSRRWAEEGEM